MIEQLKNRMIIKPSGNFLVRDPVTKAHLKPEGEVKPRNNYWLRRLASGEVVEVEQQGGRQAIETKKQEGE